MGLKIGKSEFGLKLIRQLNPIKFRYNPKKFEKSVDGRYHFGLVAQELESLLPINEYSVVTKSKEGYLMVEYPQLIAPLIRSILELDEEVAELKEEIKKLKLEKNV